MSVERDPDHSIIDRPWEYDIIGFCYQREPEDYSQPYIDLTLRKGTTIRRLRFLQPRSLKIDEGFPVRTGGMEILDVRHRQMEGVGVHVSDFEASQGAVTFWAADVVDLDETAACR
jgi:hypothetical protein